MAPCSISLGWWQLSCVGPPALALRLTLIWVRPVAFSLQCSALAGRQQSTPGTRQRVSSKGASGQGRHGANSGEGRRKPEPSSSCRALLPPRCLSRLLHSLPGKEWFQLPKTTLMFFRACSLGHPKTWQFGVLSGLWLRKKGGKDDFWERCPWGARSCASRTPGVDPSPSSCKWVMNGLHWCNGWS